MSKSIIFVSLKNKAKTIAPLLRLRVNKQRKYESEIHRIQSRLKNKNFVDRAPKHIVDQEKTNYTNLKNGIKKISLTVKSL